MNDKTTQYAGEWFERGDDDLQVMEVLLRNESIPNVVCFHAEQAAEKYLKGFLAHRERHARRVHDLSSLLRVCCEVDASFKALQHDVEFLGDLYFSSRYPDNYTVYQKKDAEEAQAAAMRVRAFVLGRVKGNSADGEPGFGTVGLIVGVVALAVFVALGAVVLRSREGAEDGVAACTEEAKLCPDGTTALRTGPNCEFAECPLVSTQEAGHLNVQTDPEMVMREVARLLLTADSIDAVLPYFDDGSQSVLKRRFSETALMRSLGTTYQSAKLVERTDTIATFGVTVAAQDTVYHGTIVLYKFEDGSWRITSP
ncbi:MAG: HEPN domain-containing protein [bacterium]|nr:HEPN domain-containing protein [bacterium]MDZ4285174.1 HEPN domain-containing protein [Patescibacteria group bacterium]